MAKSRSRLKTILLAAIWLAIVGGGMLAAISRREEFGVISYIVVGIGITMTMLFAVGSLPKKIQRRSFTELARKLFVGFLILCANLFLIVILVQGYKNLGILAGGALILFLVTFIQIFFSYIKDFNKIPGANKRRARKRSADK